jgi:hypothetical protein
LGGPQGGVVGRRRRGPEAQRVHRLLTTSRGTLNEKKDFETNETFFGENLFSPGTGGRPRDIPPFPLKNKNLLFFLSFVSNVSFFIPPTVGRR